VSASVRSCSRAFAVETTNVLSHDLEINPPIDDKVFSVETSEQERRLPVEQASPQTNWPAE
jgi:hypothetical protein